MKDAITITAIGTACLVGMLFLFARRKSKQFSIHQKLNFIMGQLDELKAESANLKAKVADFQEALDVEQGQVTTLLEQNAATKASLEARIAELEGQIGAADPVALQAIIDELRSTSENLTVLKADLVGTVKDEEPGEEETEG